MPKFYVKVVKEIEKARRINYLWKLYYRYLDSKIRLEEFFYSCSIFKSLYFPIFKHNKIEIFKWTRYFSFFNYLSYHEKNKKFKLLIFNDLFKTYGECR